jgi:choline dehydrogenase
MNPSLCEIFGRYSQPDVQYHFAPAYFVSHGLKSSEKATAIPLAASCWIQAAWVLCLASGSYQDKPLIDHNYMSTDDDVKRSIWAIN